ncbi:hypothetical protein F2Q70_00006783 [Brassica cretica]|uniref:NYN domain-containing protein n=1 Tax=Brassica cretica TaxID=69181 RepID=A0A8S9FRU3_BRACR|nr:hypothetical protein F2Q68_00023452 [Brassica cretica]KAF2570367.1 hypothetical protein F2Q70_00006783 [Brassica cretica]
MIFRIIVVSPLINLKPFIGAMAIWTALSKSSSAGYYIIMTGDRDFATPGAELKARGNYVLNAVKTTKVHGALQRSGSE